MLFQIVKDYPDVSNAVLKDLILNILMTYNNSTNALKHMQVVRANSVSYVKFEIYTSISYWIFRKLCELNDERITKWVHALMQNICTRVPEKADYRSNATKSIMSIYEDLEKQDRVRFLKFLHKYARNAKSSYRLFAVELSCCLLLHIDSIDARLASTDESSIESLQYCGISPLIDILVTRCNDKVNNTDL